MAWCGTDFTIVRVGVDDKDANNDNENSMLMCFGQNNSGYSVMLPLEQRKKEFVRAPQPIPWPVPGTQQDAVQVAFGDEHWAVVTSEGGLWTAGLNDYGQLGCGLTPAHGYASLAQVSGMLPVTSVACGKRHTLVVAHHLVDGVGQSVWGAGCNIDHQLSPEIFGCSALFMALDISNLTGEGRKYIAEPGLLVRIAGGSDFSVVSVGARVGMIGTGYPKVHDSEFEEPESPAGFRIPADSVSELPWKESQIKHLIAGCEHVLIGCVCDRRLCVWCWGYPGAGLVFEKPTEVVFDCPLQTSNEFSSMIATTWGSSVIMVSGKVWTFGGQLNPSSWPPSVGPNAIEQPKVIDAQVFDNRPIAYIGCGARHAVFVTTCGRLYVMGYCSWRGAFFSKARDNCLPTSLRTTKKGVYPVCETEILAEPRQVPKELLGNMVCGVVKQSIARRLAFLMGTHARLAGADPTRRHAALRLDVLDAALLQMILDICDAQLPQLLRA